MRNAQDTVAGYEDASQPGRSNSKQDTTLNQARKQRLHPTTTEKGILPISRTSKKEAQFSSRNSLPMFWFESGVI